MEHTPKPRQMEILRQLMISNVPLDVGFFMTKLQKSDRTVRYDIHELKEICAKYQIEIGYITKKGYYIPSAQKTECAALLIHWEAGSKESLFDEEEEKRYWKLFFCLFVQKGYITAEKLSDTYFVSRSTLGRLLVRMEEFFEGDVQLDAKKALGYRLRGDELTLRRLAVRFLTSRFKGSYTADDWYLLLPEELKSRIQLNEVRELSQTIRRMNGKYNIWISNTAYLNLIGYCVVRRVRLPLLEQTETVSEREDTYIQELLKELSIGNLGRNEQELDWLSAILSENGIYVEKYQVNEALISRVINRILDCLCRERKPEEFDLESLSQDLYEHLKNYLAMSRQDQQEEENEYVLKEITEYYYSYYQLARKLGNQIEEEIGQSLGVMEICYLAVYLYKNSIFTENGRKNVMVVCATGKGLSHFLTLRIKHVFPELNVVGQISPYQLSKASDLKNVDFAISTIPLENSVVPVIKISGVLLEDDIKRIRNFLKYGKLVDELPMKQKNEASFLSREDSVFAEEAQDGVPDENLAQAAGTMSRLILSLLEYTAKMPPQIHMSQDTMLGLVIHMSMAVPRWLSGNVQEEASRDYQREYERFRTSYPDVFQVMGKFFSLVEKTLKVRIPISERTAFFLYIIEEE